MSEPVDSGAEAAPPSAANTLFDLRTIIAVLFAVYGLVLLGMGLWGTGDAQRAKSGGLNLNLWTGAGMAVLAGLFVLWVWLRPIRPPDPDTAADQAE